MAIVGIDLGTTNSLIGLMEKGRPRLFTGEDGSTLIPSIVGFDTSGDPVVGAAARPLRRENPCETIYSAKRFMGRGKSDVIEWMKLLPFNFTHSDERTIRFRVGDKSYTPIEISSFILKKLKMIAQSQCAEKIEKAVVTVPAYFNDSQRQATKHAAELAGLEVVRIVNEPTAACLAYGLDKKTQGTIAVFDLGGGTFDISLLRVKDGVFEVLATNGDTALGGDDFDHAIAQNLHDEIKKAWSWDPWADPKCRSLLISEAEALKKALSAAETAEFNLSFQDKNFRRTISRRDLASWMAPILDRAKAPCLQCLSDSKIKKEEITDVILVGGSTRSPVVRDFVKSVFGREALCSLNPDEVVAMGATVQANVLAGQTGDVLLLDVIPLSLGIETMGGVVSKIIHRNSTIPISAAEGFTTYVDGQTSVDIHVVQGERELVKDNRSLARFQLRGIPPLPAGIPKIEVEFIIDANGLLTVRALELRTGTAANVQVNPTYGLDDAQVEKMLGDSFDNAEKDFETRFLIEAQTEAESLIRATKKSFEKGSHLIEGGERTKISQALGELEAVRGSSDRAVIKAKIEKLSQVTHHLAELILNEALQEVLKGTEVEKQE